jgi:para-aminobenzoate synthetase component 1
MRHSAKFRTDDINFKQRLLVWASTHSTFCILDSNRDKQLFTDVYSKFDFMVAVGAIDAIQKSGDQNSFDLLKEFYESKKDWLFGFLTYDLKNETESLLSENHDGLMFPEIHFFQPRLILKLSGDELEILYAAGFCNYAAAQKVFGEISVTEILQPQESGINIGERVSKTEYISTVNKIKHHIQLGDIYEMNYCAEYFAERITINPLEIYTRLNETSPMPFSCFYRINEHYLLCASPERFLAKSENKIISQPMKGTARRGKTAEEDEQIKVQLRNDEKEQSENVMIVDLVRNDLSRSAKKGSVVAEELFGIYTFRQLHQMISTVVSEKRNAMHFIDVIKQCFPMGSMTGAPKIRAMQLIEHYEKTKRGLYSGCAGYITPGGDFDFNVIIRSILYNDREKYLSFMVGSAITANSIPEKEYEECLLKAKAMLNVLSSRHPIIVND